MGVKPLTILTESFVLDVWQGIECISVLHENSWNATEEYSFGIAIPFEVMKH